MRILILFAQTVACVEHMYWEENRLWNSYRHHSVLHSFVENYSAPIRDDRLIAYDAAHCGTQIVGSSFEPRALENGNSYFEVHLFSNISPLLLCFRLYCANNASFTTIDMNNFQFMENQRDFGTTNNGLGRPTENGLRTMRLGSPVLQPSSPPMYLVSPSYPTASSQEWCSTCTQYEGDMRNPFCNATSTCDSSTIDAVIQMLRVVNSYGERDAWTRDVQLKVGTCIASLTPPISQLSKADIVAFARHRLGATKTSC